MFLPTQSIPWFCEQWFLFARVQIQANLAGGQVYFTQNKFKLLHRIWSIYSTAGRLLPTGNVSQGSGKGAQHTCIIMEFTMVSKALEREINTDY